MLRMFLLWVLKRAAEGVCHLDGIGHVGVTLDREAGQMRVTVLDSWSHEQYKLGLPCHQCPEDAPPTKKEQAAGNDLLESREDRDTGVLNESAN